MSGRVNNPAAGRGIQLSSTHLSQILFLRVTNTNPLPKPSPWSAWCPVRALSAPFSDMLISLSNTPGAPLARLWGVTWYGRRCPHPRFHTCHSCHSVLSRSSALSEGGSFMTRSPHGSKQLPNLFGEQSVTLMSPPRAPWQSCTYEVPRQGEVTGRLCKIRLYGGCGGGGGLQAEKKMNMHVHIYPENDYLLEHSLIVFHNSFCAYSPIFLLNLNKPINRD